MKWVVFSFWEFESLTTLSGKFRCDRNASPKFGSANSNICLLNFRSPKSTTHSGSESTFTVTKTAGWKLISVRKNVTRFNHWRTKNKWLHDWINHVTTLKSSPPVKRGSKISNTTQSVRPGKRTVVVYHKLALVFACKLRIITEKRKTLSWHLVT